MKQKIVFAFSLGILICSISIKAQSYPNNYTFTNTSLETATTPASIAMGESFVANPYNVSSFLENPANLAALKGMSFFYNSRSHDWIEYANNFNYSSVGLTTISAWGNIGFSLSQFSTGASTSSIYGLGRSSDDINRTYSLSLSRSIFPGLSIGFALKVFNHDRAGNINQGALESNNAYLIDAGLLYQLLKSETPKVQHEFNIGTVLQNFGTTYKEKDSYFSDQYSVVRLPRYFKIGFSYNVQIKNPAGMNNIEATLTGQYKSLINPQSSEEPDVDYWGGGFEVKIINIFTARIGVLQLPEYWSFYERATPIIRYGFGLTLPFEKLGVHIPMIIAADYSFIPIKNESLTILHEGAYVTSSYKMMHAIGISFHYNNNVF